MAIASPAVLVASTDAQSFTFAQRTSIKVQVRFYTDAAATAGNEIAASAGGSRTVTITTDSYVVDASRDYSIASVESSIDAGSKTCVGGTWYEFSLADGLKQLNVTATGGADPGGAVAYRIWLDVAPNG